MHENFLLIFMYMYTVNNASHRAEIYV